MLRALLFLTICLAVLAAGLFMATVGYEIQLGNRKAAGFLLTTLLGSPLIVASIAAQLAAMVAIYALWLTALWRISGLASSGRHWSQHPAACLAWLWLASTWLLLRAHAAWFPNSSWTWVTEPLFDRAAVWGVDLLSAVVLGYLLILAARSLVWRLKDRGRKGGFSMRRLALSPWSYLIFLFGASAVVNALAPGPAASGTLRPPAAVTTNTNRDVVILGLDSLRREVIEDPAFWGMPNLAALVASGYLNDNVVTPLARTFPSWVTILTGLHPTQSGARTNHAPQEGVARGASMAWTFRDAGYRTVYATDETRFSHIVPAFGFDEVIGPQIGVTDFLLGQFSDQPLINILVQMPGAEHFLPALVGNRAFAHAYVPERFNRRFVSALGNKDDRPLFLSVHLCTAHWPFFAAEAGRAAGPQEAGDGPMDLAAYRHMLRLVDRQLGDLLDQLRSSGYLTEESLLVVLSDHGEGLPSDGEAPLSVHRHGVDEDLNLNWPMGGHGASLLAPEQWQSFVLFSGAGRMGSIEAGRSSALASLEDVAPKVRALVFGDGAEKFDHEISPAFEARTHVLMETGWAPSGFNILNPDGSAALRIAESSYNVLPDGRIEMKPEVYQAAMGRKSIGITNGDESLVLTEIRDQSLLVVADIEMREWNVHPARSDSPAPIDSPLLPLACDYPEIRSRIRERCEQVVVRDTNVPAMTQFSHEANH